MTSFREYLSSGTVLIGEAADQSLKFYKTLGQDDIDRFAALAPGYDAKSGRWGDYSLWVVSCVNRMVKAGRKPDDIYAAVSENLTRDLECFAEYRKELGGNIDRYRSFDELSKAVSKYVAPDGSVVRRKSKAQMSNRTRTAISKMKNMTVLVDNAAFMLASPDDFETNEQMSAVGRWCHTGDSANGRSFWDEYTGYGPLYYLVDKSRDFVLCMSYARQKEIRNQFDVQPSRIGDTGNWDPTVETSSAGRSGNLIPYVNTDKDWTDFMAWLDPTGEVGKAVESYEAKYEEKVGEQLEEKARFNVGRLRATVRSGVLIIDSDDIRHIFGGLLHADVIELPDRDEFDDDDAYGEAYDMATRRNEEHIGVYNKHVMPVLTDFLKDVKSIRLGKHTDSMFYESDYPGELPDIDCSDVKSLRQMFAHSKIRHIPRLLNTDGVEDISSAFKDCVNATELPDMVFPSAIRVGNAFAGMSSLEKAGDIIIPKAK